MGIDANSRISMSPVIDDRPDVNFTQMSLYKSYNESQRLSWFRALIEKTSTARVHENALAYLIGHELITDTSHLGDSEYVFRSGLGMGKIIDFMREMISFHAKSSLLTKNNRCSQLEKWPKKKPICKTIFKLCCFNTLFATKFSKKL
jgi:hypothetical protein